MDPIDKETLKCACLYLVANLIPSAPLKAALISGRLEVDGSSLSAVFKESLTDQEKILKLVETLPKCGPLAFQVFLDALRQPEVQCGSTADKLEEIRRGVIRETEPRERPKATDDSHAGPSTQNPHRPQTAHHVRVMRREIEEAIQGAYDTSFGVAVVPKHWFSQCRHLVERKNRRPPLPLEHLPKDSPILESDKLLHISLPCALQLSMIVGGTVSFTHHYHYNGGTLVNEKFNHIVYMAVGLWPKGEIASAATPETEEKTMKKVWVNTRITVKEAVMKGLRFEPARAQSLSDGADIALDILMWDWWKDDLSKILYIFSKVSE